MSPAQRDELTRVLSEIMDYFASFGQLDSETADQRVTRLLARGEEILKEIESMEVDLE